MSGDNITIDNIEIENTDTTPPATEPVIQEGTTELATEQAAPVEQALLELETTSEAPTTEQVTSTEENAEPSAEATKENKIKVTVVMPIYNAYDYIRPALDSIIAQTLTDIELICVDDGSTDRSLHVLTEYQQKDERIRIITENNAGPSLARNKGLLRARGEFVIFMDADDFCEPTMLEKLYHLAVSENLDIAVAKYDIYNNMKAKFEPSIPSDHGELFGGGKILSPSECPDQIFQCITGYVWNKLYRHSFLKEKGLAFDPELKVFEDVYFVMTSLSLASRVGKLQEILFHHRVYSEQAKPRLFRKYFRQVPLIYVRIKEFLMSHGMFIPLSQSYLNLSASRAYKIYNLLWWDAKGAFYNLYHGEYAELLGWSKAKPEDFESAEVRDFVANILMYNHSKYKKREDDGKKVDIENVDASLRKQKWWRGFTGFFARLFGKKDKQ